MSDKQFTTEELEKYLNNRKGVGVRTLSTLGALKPFLDAVKTEIGCELLKDLVSKREDLEVKILNDITQINPSEAAEYNILTNMIKKWASRINEYNTKIKEVYGNK